MIALSPGRQWIVQVGPRDSISSTSSDGGDETRGSHRSRYPYASGIEAGRYLTRPRRSRTCRGQPTSFSTMSAGGSKTSVGADTEQSKALRTNHRGDRRATAASVCHGNASRPNESDSDQPDPDPRGRSTSDLPGRPSVSAAHRASSAESNKATPPNSRSSRQSVMVTAPRRPESPGAAARPQPSSSQGWR